jgi:hypothetical protein
VANCNNNRLYQTGLQDEQDKVKPILNILLSCQIKLGIFAIKHQNTGDGRKKSEGKIKNKIKYFKGYIHGFC